MAYTEDHFYRLRIVAAECLKVASALEPSPVDGAPLGDVNSPQLLHFAQTLEDQAPQLPGPVRKGGIDPRAEAAALSASLRVINLRDAGDRAAHLNESLEKLGARDASPAPYEAK